MNYQTSKKPFEQKVDFKKNEPLINSFYTFANQLCLYRDTNLECLKFAKQESTQKNMRRTRNSLKIEMMHFRLLLAYC